MEQIPNLDYTEPAFQLDIAAGDDKSIVTFTYSVGTIPDGTDVVDNDEFSGPSAIIEEVIFKIRLVGVILKVVFSQ